MLSKLKNAKKVVGTKQTKRAVINNQAKEVLIAKDADSHIVTELIQLCEDMEINIVYVDTMVELGKVCDIDVNAASVAILN